MWLQLMSFVCSRFSAVLFNAPGFSRMMTQHVVSGLCFIMQLNADLPDNMMLYYVSVF